MLAAEAEEKQRHVEEDETQEIMPSPASSANRYDPHAARLVPLDVSTVARYYLEVIRSFRSPEAEKIWRGERSSKLPSDIQDVVRRKLRMLHNAQNVQDLRVPPNNRLEALKGDRKGQHSIRVNDQWRVCFRWREGEAHDVEIVDYHGG